MLYVLAIGKCVKSMVVTDAKPHNERESPMVPRFQNHLRATKLSLTFADRISKVLPQMLSRLFRNHDPAEVAQICSATRLSRRTARRILHRFDVQRYSEIAELLLAQNGSLLYHDPIEDLPELARTFQNASADTDAELAGVERGMGFCHRFWRTKKGILATKYGVDWLTPSEMNRGVRFD